MFGSEIWLRTSIKNSQPSDGISNNEYDMVVLNASTLQTTSYIHSAKFSQNIIYN